MNNPMKKWYEKTWVIVLFIILFFPVGLYVLWINPRISKRNKIYFTAVVAGLVIIGVVQDKKPPNVAVESHTTKSSMVNKEEPQIQKASLATPVSEKQRAAVNPPNAEKSFEQEISELRSSIQKTFNKIQEVEGKYTTFQIQGEITNWDGNSVGVWGQAIPCIGNTNTLGTVLSQGNIVIQNGDVSQKRNRIYITSSCEDHYFLNKKEGKSKMGLPVDVYIYGARPAELNNEYSKLSPLLSKRDELGKIWLRKQLASNGHRTEEQPIEKLKALSGFLQEMNQFNGIQIGTDTSQVEGLNPLSLKNKEFTYYVFPDDGVIISSDMGKVLSIGYVLQLDLLAKYFSYLEKSANIKSNFNARIPLDAPIVSKSNYVRTIGWKQMGGNVNWLPELYNSLLIIENVSGAKSEYIITCQSDGETTNVLAATVVNRSIPRLNMEAFPFGSELADLDPVLEIRRPRL